MKLARRLLRTKPLEPYYDYEDFPGDKVQSDEELMGAAKERGTTTFHPAGTCRMPTITTRDGTQIYYNDWGKGQPVVFSHGWPLSADAWDDQMLFLASHGYRCIAHDRRGHGARPRLGA